MAEDVENTPQLLRVKKRPTPSQSTVKASGPFRATQLWNNIVQHLREQIKLKRCKGRMKTYEYCFAGSKAVDVVLHYLRTDKVNFGDKDISRDKAVKLCQLMIDFRVIESRGKDKDDSISGFDDSSTKYYQFLSEGEEDGLTKENELCFGIVNQACTEHEEFIESAGKIRTRKNAGADVSLNESLQSSTGKSGHRHGPVVSELMELTGSWKRYSAECLRKLTPAKLFSNRRPSLQDITLNSPNTSDISIDVDRLPPAVEEELVKEIALSNLLTVVDLPILENILSYDASTPRPLRRQGFSNLAFRARNDTISSISNSSSNPEDDTWWEAGLDCLENHPRGLEILDESLNEYTNLTQKLRMFQALSDHYTKRESPLWSDKFMDVHLALFNLLMQSRQDMALKAVQLSMILLHGQEREELRRLFRFLKYAVDDDAVHLSSTNTNRRLIEKTFSNCIIKNKMMTPHQSGHVVMFMVDHAFELFETPMEIEDAVLTRIREIIRGRNKLPRSEKTYCIQVSEDEYKHQQTEETSKCLVDLMNSILDDTKFSLKEKRQRLKQFQKHHADLFEKHFSDML